MITGSKNVNSKNLTLYALLSSAFQSNSVIKNRLKLYFNIIAIKKAQTIMDKKTTRINIKDKSKFSKSK